MKQQKLEPKTRKQIAQEIGISYSTLWRLLGKKKVNLPSGLIYPKDQKKIYDLIMEGTDSVEGFD